MVIKIFTIFGNLKVTNQLKSELAEDELIVNLASNEYFSVINSKEVSNKIISPQFKDFKNGTLKIISFYAKKGKRFNVKVYNR